MFDKYSGTFVAVIIALCGWFGVGHLVTDGEVATIVNNILELVGLGMVLVRRYQSGDVNVLGVKK